MALPLLPWQAAHEAANVRMWGVLLSVSVELITELNKAEELAKIVRQYQGKSVTIAYERDGEARTAQATINTRK